MIFLNYNNYQYNKSETHDELLWPPSIKAMGKRPSIDFFTSIIGKQVAATV
jgi:hypothetical protein